ncbi:MAG: AEC family transporter [Bariatricus sp.]
MLLFQQMIVLFIYMLIGFICCKKRFLDNAASEKISWLVLNISNPCMILSSAVNSDGSIRGKELLMTVGIAVGVYAFMLVLSHVLPVLLGIPKHDRGIYSLMTVFNNIGFMGFPVIVAMYGEGALLYASVFTLLYNLLFYTYGIQLVSEEGNSIGNHLKLRQIINTGIIASVIAVVLYLMEIPTPEFFKTTVKGLSNLAAPLSMIVIGISLAGIRLKELFLDVKMLVFSFIKLLVIPIAGVYVIRLIVSNEVILGVCMVMLATPAGSMTAMLAQQYHKNYEMTAKGVALTTILSVITMPIVSMLVL